MATQDTNVTNNNDTTGTKVTNNYGNSVQYKFDYGDDKGIFERFLKEHTIITILNNNNSSNDDDDDILEIPNNDMNSTVRLTRRNCYMPHFQRIRNRHYYSQEELAAIGYGGGNDGSNTTNNNNNNNNSTDINNRVFIIEIPLDELVEWDNIKGKDLADRAAANGMRYHGIFCDAIDQIIESLPQETTTDTTTTDTGGVRDTVDVLHQQRLAVVEQNRRNNNNDTSSNNNNNNNATNNNNNNPLAGVVNVYAQNGNVANDAGAMNETNANSNNNNNATEDFPPILMRRYELRILPYKRKGSLPPFTNQQHGKNNNSSNEKPLVGLSLRQIRSAAVGKLLSVTGMIVRSSDVKPSCQVATYSCDVCGAEIYQVLSLHNREFMPARTCPSNICQQNSKKNQQSLHLQTRGSRLVKFQEMKIQELPNQVPMGHVPRSLSVLCRGELTRQGTPGDIVTIDGVFLPQRIAESGYRAMKAGLVSITYIEAQNILVHKKSFDESIVDTLSENECSLLDAQIIDVATGEDPIGRLAASIAPEIFGHEDIKRSLLLQLVGGCTRILPDGMRIRGDINICLMGDPGVAKSQLLKHVASIAPRGVYTTGKGSSGVGLTAAVTKDLATGDMALEGGALVLADRGICCIDEFDKMDESDRTSIHEVMEQQTVSIAKAGIIATLNARASVLAAANPLYGRYNRNKTLSENINLPNSLLSRFDLLFLILDGANIDKDIALARHVTFVHQSSERTSSTDDEQDGANNNKTGTTTTTTKSSQSMMVTTSNQIVSPQVLREYIARARKYQPVVPPDVAPYVVEAYVSLRMEQKENNNRGSYRRRGTTSSSSTANDQTVMTARQLLSILRLSQALARLRFSDYVAREDVDEAIRLTHMSKASLLDDDDNMIDPTTKRQKRGEDIMSRIFNILRDYATILPSSAVAGATTTEGKKGIELKTCQAMILRKGFTQQQLDDCIKEYESLNVIQINRTRTHIFFV